MPDDPLRERLRRLPGERLIDELIDLADRDPSVRDRVNRLSLEGDAEALAAALTKDVKRLRRKAAFVGYGASFAFAQGLQHIVDTARERLLPLDADLAFEVADLFLQSDAKVCETVDDSAGVVGDVFRDACKLWLEAAAGSKRTRDWVGVFRARVAKNDYGLRDELLPHAAILFPEATLRAMAAGYLEEAAAAKSARGERDYAVLSATVAAGQLGVALRDPRLYEEATAALGGSLNDLQREKVARRYLEFGDPAGALAHARAMSDAGEVGVLGLMAECLEQLGRVPEQIAALESLFEGSLWTTAYEKILALRPEGEREATRAWARSVALSFRRAGSAAAFLFDAGLADDAERLAYDRAGELAACDYTELLELAKRAHAAGRAIVEAICYRHLIRDILGDARSKAYGHAARYLEDLEALDRRGVIYGPIGDHAAFVAELRRDHGRKTAFWGKVERKRR